MRGEKPKYCPSCRSKLPMIKAGISRLACGERQRWKCVNKPCSKITINPLLEKK